MSIGPGLCPVMHPLPSNTPPLPDSSFPNYWEELYQSGDKRWDKGAAAPGLLEFLHQHPELPRSAVAVPGCGLGHDVRAWAAHGFQAHGFDVAPSAIRLATGFEAEGKTCRSASAGTRRGHCPSAALRPGPGDGGLGGGTAAYHLANFLTAAPPFLFDYLFEHTLFCAIQPRQRDAYVDSVRRWLKPGGIYLAVHYIVCEGEPPFPVSRAELWQRFQPGFHLIDQWIPRSYPNRTGRELMSWWQRK